MEYRQNEQLLLATEFVQYTNKNIFLTGKAGTGKTTFLHNLRKVTPKRIVVVAPTGVAAINAGGVTMHSFFQLSFAPSVPEPAGAPNGTSRKEGFQRKFNRDKIRLFKCIDLLVIDEISMVRADILDAVDEVLRKYRDHRKPFGGVQLLMIGDLHQLSPVVREAEWNILKNYYNSAYFFDSRALRKTHPVTIELQEIFRQSDAGFIALLNKVRENKIDPQTIAELNSRYIAGFRPGEEEGYITLTTHNANAISLNQAKLKSIPGASQYLEAVIEGDFPPHDFPTEEKLELKPHAQVMFIKNDPSPEKQYYNGKIGRITRIEDGVVYVKCPSVDSEIAAGRVTWHNIKYSLNEETREIREEILGSFTQVPLKLAWAITIHKSQGLTFEKVIIDANAAFAFGQVYVALSRCRTFQGIVLSSPISGSGIKTDAMVSNYTHEAQQRAPGAGLLAESKYGFQQELFFELFDFKPTKYKFESLLRLAHENSKILDPKLIPDLEAKKTRVEAELYQVAEKFKLQLTTLLQPALLPEDNQPLQQRTRQAALYFSNQMKTHFSGLRDKINFDTDNKALKKLLSESLEKLDREVFIKLSCLEKCQGGFDTISYIRTRSDAEVDFRPQSGKKIQPDQEYAKSIRHPELYAALKKWRDSVADENNTPRYMVLPQKSILELMNKLPATPAGLKTIKGIGQARLNQFGDEILTIIQRFCSDHAIVPEDVSIPVPGKKARTDTAKVSFDLFNSGKTIVQIAAERNITVATVEGHLARFVGTGDLPVTRFVTADKLRKVMNYISDNPKKSVGEIKGALGGSVTYSELKFILQHLSHENS